MLLALLPVLAAGGVIDPGSGTLLGWSADGQALVWTSADTASSFPKTYYLMKDDERVDVPDPSKLSAADRAKLQVDEEPMEGQDPQLDETVSLATVHDVRRGSDQKFLLSYKAVSKEGRAKGELKKKYASLPNAAAFEAWKKQHPLTMTASRTGKKGKAAVTVKLTTEDDKPAWKRDTLTWSVGEGATVTLATTCGKDTASEVIAQEMGAMYTPTWSATPYWDPTGHRVLFVLKEAVAKTMRGEDGGRTQYVLVPCGPRVDVLAPAGSDALTGKIADAVEAAGFTVVSIGVPKAKRAATVIYADPAHTEVAAKLVPAIPGGATVDKLTWKPKADLVIAIGDSAK